MEKLLYKQRLKAIYKLLDGLTVGDIKNIIKDIEFNIDFFPVKIEIPNEKE